jgi:hypothetical protein
LARQPKNNSLSPYIFSAKEFHGSPSPPHFFLSPLELEMIFRKSFRFLPFHILNFEF